MGCYGLNWSGLGYGPIEGLCEHNNEPGGSIKYWEILKCTTRCFSRRAQLHGVSQLKWNLVSTPNKIHYNYVSVKFYMFVFFKDVIAVHSKYYTVTCVGFCAWLYKTLLDWMIGLLHLIYSQLGTTGNYIATADLHTLQFTDPHTLGFSVFTSRILAMDLSQSVTSTHTLSLLCTA
jgi:hypothetical protein